MKLANRYVEKLHQQGLQLLWQKYRELPGGDMSPESFGAEHELLLAGTIAESLTPQSREFGVLVSDLRGFTPMTEHYPPLAIVELLNHYFRAMVRIIDSHGGVIDKFMGDSVMAVFDSRDQPRAARQLLDCAIDMQLEMDSVNLHAKRLGVPDIHMGIGINYGSMVVCELGSEIYREMTVLGDQVNLTARLTAFCLRGQILMSETMHNLLNGEVVVGSVNEVHVKGKTDAVTTYEVLGSTGESAKLLPVRDCRKNLRVTVNLPVSYFTIEEKSVAATPIQARILDISRQGMRILTSEHHSVLDEIKIVIPFLTGASSNEIYAKVLNCKQEKGDMGGEKFAGSVEFTYMDDSTAAAMNVFVNHLV